MDPKCPTPVSQIRPSPTRGGASDWHIVCTKHIFLVNTSRPIRLDAVAAAVKRATSLNDATARVARRLAAALSVPIAVLSRGNDGWRFEAEGFPKRSTGDPTPYWAVVPVGHVAGRDWMLMLPGRVSEWNKVPELDRLISRLWGDLVDVAKREHESRR